MSVKPYLVICLEEVFVSTNKDVDNYEQFSSFNSSQWHFQFPQVVIYVCKCSNHCPSNDGKNRKILSSTM